MDAGLVAYLSATIVFAATPGPTTAVVIRNTLAGGFRAGLATAAGAATANSTYATLSAVGLAVLIAGSPMVLRVLQVGGGVYLAWLALQSTKHAIRGRPPGAFVEASGGGRTGYGTSYRQGLIANILNPPIVTFYLVVIPSFLPAGPHPSRFALFAALHVTIAFSCHAIWSGLFRQIGSAFTGTQARRVFDAATAVALAAMAARVLLR
jgi:threonine/homoserine/homoserine lactone efflux protein